MGLDASEPHVGRERLIETLHAAIGSVAVNGGKAPPGTCTGTNTKRQATHQLQAAQVLEVVLCDTSIYQMSTSSRQGAKLDPPGTLRKPKMVPVPHTANLVSFARCFGFSHSDSLSLPKYILFNHPSRSRSMSEPQSTQSIASTAIVLDWTFTGLAMLVVGLRFYTRTRLIKALGLDDFIILTSVVCVARRQTPHLWYHLYEW